MSNNLVTIIIERLDKEQRTRLIDVDNFIHIYGRGMDEYYKILGNREDINDEWLEETIKHFYSTHLNVPEKIKITYFKEDKSKL